MKIKIVFLTTLVCLSASTTQVQAKYYGHGSYSSGHKGHHYGFKAKYGYYPRHFRHYGKQYYKGYPYEGYHHTYKPSRQKTYAKSYHRRKEYYHPYYDRHNYEYFYSRRYGKVYVKYPKHHHKHDHGYISNLDYYYCR